MLRNELDKCSLVWVEGQGSTKPCKITKKKACKGKPRRFKDFGCQQADGDCDTFKSEQQCENAFKAGASCQSVDKNGEFKGCATTSKPTT